MRKILLGLLLWSVGVITASLIAEQVVAQQLVPPPPVLGITDPTLAQMAIKLDNIERAVNKNLRATRAMYAKLFPFKIEQGLMDEGAQ